ncbi:hypothetical protein F4777DRAFT_375197 [Nemania sp. FL0916]|nr:hypothetical protein F4777DRAFT_375197 [Nemania sp. FL0916]
MTQTRKREMPKKKVRIGNDHGTFFVTQGLSCWLFIIRLHGLDIFTMLMAKWRVFFCGIMMLPFVFVPLPFYSSLFLFFLFHRSHVNRRPGERGIHPVSHHHHSSLSGVSGA